MKSSNLRKLLLTGSALVAVGAFAPAALAADIEMAGATDLSAVGGDDIHNLVDDATDTGFVNVDNGVAAATITSDFDGTLFIYDGTNDTASGDTLTVGAADIASGTTLTVYFGGTLADGTGTDGAEEGNLTITNNINGGSASTRGGTLTLIGVTNDATGPGVVAVGGNTLMTAVNVTGGAGGAGEAGAAVTATFGDASSDTFNVTGMTVGGGLGAANAGGAATATVNGTASIGTSGIAVTGGTGGAGAAGGASSLTFNHGVTVTGGTVTVTGGTDAANNGGASTLVFNSTVTSNGALSIVAPASAGAGTAGAATVTLRDDTTFSAITLDSGEAAATLVADVATDDTGDFTVTGAINGAIAGDGTLTITDDSAVTADTVTFASAIGNLFRIGTINVGTGGGGEGGHAIFNSTVAATTINVGAADTSNENVTADFNGNVTATTINVVAETSSGDATANFAGNVTAAITIADAGADDANEATVRFDGTSAQTITGAITTGNDDEGNVIVGNTGTNSAVTFVNAIGANAGGELNSFAIVSGSTATIQDDIFTNIEGAGSVAVDVNGTLNIDASTNAISVAEDTGDIDVDGTVSITGDNNVDITAASDLLIDGTFTTALTAAATTTLASNNATSIGATSDTTLNVGNQVITTGDVFLGGNTGMDVTLYVNQTAAYDPTATAAILANGDTIELDSDSVFNVGLFANSVEYDAGDQILVIDSDEAVELDNVDTDYATLVTNGNVVLLNNGLIDLSVVTAAVTEAEDLVLEIGFNDAEGVFEDGSTGVGAADALLAMTNAQTTGNLQTIRGNLISAGSDAAAQDIAEAIAPTVDAGAVVAGMTVTQQTSGVTNDRLASLRDGTGETGMVAGNVSQGLKLWGQVFGVTGDQSERDGVAGYDVDTVGMTVGLDTETLAENWVWGMAFSYANSDVDSDNVNNTETEIDSYQVSLYGEYALDERTFINGQVGYVWGSNDQTRYNVGGLAGVNATSDYDSDQFLARLEAGRNYGMAGNATVTPKVLANYAYYDADDYTETGAGTANLSVDSDSLSLFELGVGVDVAWLNQYADGSYLKPAVHAGVRHDLIGDEYATTSNFTGGGAAFDTDGFDPAQTTFNVGAGLTYYSTTNWQLSADYDFEVKSDYDAHAGVVRAAYKF